MNTLIIQKVQNGFLVISKESEETMVFITLKELLNYVAACIGDMDTEFNVYQQEVEIVDKVFTA